ncbi:MAG: hypothetical protein AN488_19465 [Anabaena sp. WA113]|jgi:hypothetical protein|uniref:Transposase n=1 Tax=Aphanizomenon flos-aquae WA102 TaxID=1710896 RepID=A0A1B7X8I3_APHFL|nr:MAG: hypothetical protein AN488_19465 [Anabaena sp. WA113]OBQ45693.1 MAG: hypothetical protein AN484_00340 [Aphanizomenon flos-aquae WA102]
MYGCQQILISPNQELGAILEFLCGESNKLANCGTYYARQLFFRTGKIPSKFDLHRKLASNSHFGAMQLIKQRGSQSTIALIIKLVLSFLVGMSDKKTL